MTQASEAEFYALVDQFFQRMMEESPVAATQLGDHRFDHKLGDHSPPARARQEKMLREALAQLEGMDDARWSADARIDHTLVVRLARSFLREIEKLQHYQRSPGMYVNECLGGVFLLLMRDFAPFRVQMRSAVGRLREVPRVLAQGKENIVPERVPKVWAETALEGAKRGLILFRVVLPLLSLRTPWLFPQVLLASRRAARALGDYVRFLEREVLPQARGQFAVGKELFEEMLREDHLLDYSADELLELGWKLLRDTRAQMETLAAKVAPGKTAREIIEEAKKDHPSARELLPTYRREMARARRFVEERGIVTTPQGETLRIRPTPPSMRPVIPYAAYMMPGPLEEKQEGTFLVTPVERLAPRRVREEKLRGHWRAKIPITALHEAYPGHHLQLVYANRHAKTLPRKVGSALSSLFVEGWAFYCEELMESLGFLDQRVQKMARLQDQLWRAARIVLDVSLHTGRMTVDEAIEFLVKEAGLEEPNARAEVRRYTASPTQPMSYLIGKLEILKVIEEYKRRRPGASLREIHDAILACGSLPPKLLRERLLAG
ncbi:MAG: DUF885 domain-containing protein [Candidatus Acetothermia bacterium]|jgi:uncharacterized protein (DUF885 family)|nr:DUF885 domain-containing protein [Candidatus Acetothermia bacterium]